MAGRLEGKATIVIGAGSSGPGWGNGKATAVLFAREGARVACVDRVKAAAEETAHLVSGEGVDAIALEADAVSDSDIRKVVERSLEAFGRIDVLDNNVGIVEVGSVVDLPEDRWDRTFSANVKSAYLAMKHVIPHMTRQGGGAIVNISSISGIRHTGVPFPAYASSKAALNHLTRMTAVEFAPGNVRVNTVIPGLIRTPLVERSAGLSEAYSKGEIADVWRERDAQVPMGRQGSAWDVAEAALFLASDAAAYITGAELVVDGGLTLKCG